MKLSVFGLGYVGAVTAACLAEAGNEIIGIERVREKVALFRTGRVPFVEPRLPDIIATQVSNGRLEVTEDACQGVLGSDASMICVGTPSLSTGQLDFTALDNVCTQIGQGIAGKSSRHLVVIRSTTLPGTAERCIQLIEQASSKKSGSDFAVLCNPEFMREGTALRDFQTPPFTVIGAEREEDARMIGGLYSHVEAPLFLTDLPTSQMVKYACNLFHALKVVFGNEIGRICRMAGVDGHRVMDIFCADSKLNLSAYYLRPGFAYGGSCLPKDLRAILAFARENHVAVPMLERLEDSNRLQIEQGIQLILDTGAQRIGILGFSFKPNTDDLRESPHVALVEALLGKGRKVCIYDPNINFARLIGANRLFIDRSIPHVVDLLSDNIEEVVANCKCLVIANRDAHFEQIRDRIKPEQVIVDLVGLSKGWTKAEQYRGLA